MHTVGARESREFEGLLVSTDLWPLILMEFPERKLSDDALRGGLQAIEDLLDEARKAREKTYQVTDLTRMHELAPASQRKYAGEWMKRTHALQRTASIGGANVTPSTIVRGLVTAINWIQPAPTPTIFVATRKEAFALAAKAFDDASVRLRPEVRLRLVGR
jgi:RecJ-like exonuclease